MVGGILKNPLSKEQVTKEDTEDVAEFRKQVLKNTQLNAKLTSGLDSKMHMSLSQGGESHILPKDTLTLKHEHDVQQVQDDEEKLQWNQKNLEDNEIAKLQYKDIHVDEPKTPYQGAVDPNGEYYKIDDENDDLDDFSLGEAEYDTKPTLDEDRLEENVSEQAEQLEEDDKEARHKKFEEMRKKHYNVKEIFKNKHLHEDEDDEDTN
ncbi:hypothetical protein Kpol_513p29 [Vanderwaltozyma polyspora DSM 70294]|uniref:Protein GLC8 n=1 Tax=Vanderwaltozyma polyspora (strain ATCC 22028 / DSM 70294 / BCRC 21397 / CBS 2163 / NBRC 10782 / NRRL Y-8283 / UCD 57-17) TaxID=436907 RepID=A7TML5_VANPO|nr:uncharacterized protein Kpol_513p29 [Vanderwaltozyma polyspora DSM 70294]EDO16513.1 hypothetical protein Kpol_513p29 [Vanderwaltozyma polyspora DSM 70294]